MDFGKIFEAVKVSVAALAIVTVFYMLMGLLNSYEISLVLWLLRMGLNFLIVCYAGYAAIKNLRLDLLSAGVAGSITLAIGGIINRVIIYAFALAGLGAMEQVPSNITDIAIEIGVYLITIVIGFVAGIIGGFAVNDSGLKP